MTLEQQIESVRADLAMALREVAAGNTRMQSYAEAWALKLDELQRRRNNEAGASYCGIVHV